MSRSLPLFRLAVVPVTDDPFAGLLWRLDVNLQPSRPTTPTLHRDGFILRPLRPTDSAAWFGYLSDPRTTEHTSWPEVSAEMIAALVARLIGEYETRVSSRWALARKTDDELVGTCGFTRINPERGIAELAYDLAPAYWGRGMMGAVVESVVQWGFQDAGLRRIEAFVMVSNDRSIALLERCGFTREQFLAAHRLARGEARDFWRYVRNTGRPHHQSAG